MKCFQIKHTNWHNESVLGGRILWKTYLKHECVYSMLPVLQWALQLSTTKGLNHSFRRTMKGTNQAIWREQPPDNTNTRVVQYMALGSFPINVRRTFRFLIFLTPSSPPPIPRAPTKEERYQKEMSGRCLQISRHYCFALSGKCPLGHYCEWPPGATVKRKRRGVYAHCEESQPHTVQQVTRYSKSNTNDLNPLPCHSETWSHLRCLEKQKE